MLFDWQEIIPDSIGSTAVGNQETINLFALRLKTKTNCKLTECFFWSSHRHRKDDGSGLQKRSFYLSTQWLLVEWALNSNPIQTWFWSCHIFDLLLKEIKRRKYFISRVLLYIQKYLSLNWGRNTQFGTDIWHIILMNSKRFYKIDTKQVLKIIEIVDYCLLVAEVNVLSFSIKVSSANIDYVLYPSHGNSYFH